MTEVYTRHDNAACFHVVAANSWKNSNKFELMWVIRSLKGKKRKEKELYLSVKDVRAKIF